ncbi:MAG: HD domain-containing protein, partial [Treponema sp.]|nr:HD domain-containing protein [Treponema sp.]
MTFYSSIIIITELLMFAMVLHVINYAGFSKNQKVWYLLTFLDIMLCAGAEYFVHNGYYNPAFILPLTIITVIQFSAAPLLGILFIGALGMKRQTKIAIVFFCLNLITEIIAAPFGWIFYFNSDGYFRGQFFIIYEIYYFLSLLYLIINMIIIGKRFRHRDILTIIMILVILVAGIIPMTIFSINITYIAIAIGASLVYIYYNDLVQQDTMIQLLENQRKISTMQNHVISGLANLIENRDTDTGEHISRTSTFVRLLAENALEDGVYTEEINEHFIMLMYTLAPMHDIGKILVSDKILKKPGKLTPEEFEQMKKHASLGGKVVKEVLEGITDDEYLDFASDIAVGHHEKWDGSGYPYGLAGEKIPLPARIMAIADVFDALISKRCYKEAIPFDQAVEIIRESSGTHF